MRDAGLDTIGVAIALPLLDGAPGLAAAAPFAPGAGDVVRTMVRAAGIPCITVPAAVPEAGPGLRLSTSPGICSTSTIREGHPIRAGAVERPW